MTKTIAVAVLLGAWALLPGVASADEADHSLEELVVEMAHTPQQHTALARHYREKAAEAREEVKLHEKMASSYSGGPPGKMTGGRMQRRQKMGRHCKSIADKYAEMATDYEELARLHDEEAAQKE